MLTVSYSRIRSAGATLRRYGEEALQKEVHALLTEWRAEILDLQCVFIRASHREKRVSNTSSVSIIFCFNYNRPLTKTFLVSVRICYWDGPRAPLSRFLNAAQYVQFPSQRDAQH